jgi:sortase (surface protein transpeptidase)
MRARAPRGPRRAGLWFLVAVAGCLGAVLVVVAVASQDPSPPRLEGPVGTLEPSRPTGTSGPSERTSPPPEVGPAEGSPLGPSRPLTIEIPAIGVRSDVLPIGKTRDGSLAVPQPGPNLDKAAWFENSPTPGQPGPSVIEGHVSTDEGGPSVFFDLAELRPGDRVRVEREDGVTVLFTVRALREFAKDSFPTRLVYGGDLSEPGLRLITCSSFDPSVGNHTANLVVFAELTRVVGG